MFKCPECGFVSVDEGKCPKCGTVLDEVDPFASPEKEEPEPAESEITVDTDGDGEPDMVVTPLKKGKK